RAVLAEAEAGLAAPIARERIGVVLGVAAGTELMQDMSCRLSRPMLLNALRADGLDETRALRIADRFSAHFGEWRESTFPGLLGNVVAGRIANRLDLGGVNFTADAACASSLAALKHACAELHEGEADLILTGGADALNAIFMYMCFSKTPAMSAKGRCSPFSDDADGTLMGEGAGLLALRRLEDAERDGNAIYAVIRGVGAASDGRATSVYAPRSAGQARAIRRALARAGVAPESIGLVEAHGTGTRAGDLAEVEGLKQVYGAEAAVPWCALGSVKSQIGHTKSAAGAASLIKCALALHQGVLPPTLHVRRPDPRLGLEGSPFHLSAQARPWVSAEPRRAAVSSFGFGGSNFHAVLEEYRGPGQRPPRLRTLPSELILVSGTSRAEAAARLNTIGATLREDADLPAAAAEAQAAFDVEAPVRLAVVAPDRQGFLSRAEAAEAHLQGRLARLPADVLFGEGAPAEGGLAFVFSGQGSQYVGMGADLALHFPVVRDVWDAHAALDGADGTPLHARVFPPSAFDEATAKAQAAALTRTECAQPALAVTALGQLALMARIGLTAEAVAGHSFGELMALHAAGALQADAAVRLARARGQAMAEAASGAEGAMLAVAAPRAEVEAALAGQAPEVVPDVVLANDNAPAQVVLSGPAAAVAEAGTQLRALGFTTRTLPVATAFHSPLVAPAARAFAAALARETLSPARLPVLANTTAAPYPAKPEAMAETLAQQLARPVRFRESIEALYAEGVRHFIEIGPGAALTGLVGATLGDRAHLALALDRRGVDGVTQFWRTLGALSVAGQRLNLAALWNDLPAPARRPVPPAHALSLCGANYNKPYPPPAPGGETASPPPSAATAGPSLAAPRAAEPAAPAPDRRPAGASEAGPPPIAPEIPREPIPGTSKDATMDNDTPQTLVRLHEAMAREHGRFLEQTTLAHRSFLEASAQAMAALQGLHSDRAVGHTGQVQALPVDLPVATVPVPVEPALKAGVAVMAASADPNPNPPPTAGAEADPPSPVPAGAPSRTANVAPDPAAAMSVVLDVVAERTGYPVEMLEPGMDLEADLGIDSIKQVEILSALQEALPGTADIAPEALSELRTLGDVAQAIGSGTATPAPPGAGPDAGVNAPSSPSALERDAPSPQPPVQGAPDIPVVPGPTAPAEAAAALVIEVVAERTGYPPEMLEPGMDLEADLGIDSIKQVEILSALAERRPDAAQLDPAALGEIRTLADVIAALDRQGVAEGAPTPSIPALSSPQTPATALAEPMPPRWLVALEERPLSATGPALLPPSTPVEITAEVLQVAEDLAKALADAGLDPRVVGVPSGEVGTVVVTAGLARGDPVAAARAALAAAAAAAPAMARPGALFVTLQDTGGDFARSTADLTQAAHGGAPGLVRTAAQEWPGTRVRAIDLDLADMADTAGAAIAQEILQGSETVVGLRTRGQRTGGLHTGGLHTGAQRLVPVERRAVFAPPMAPARLREDGFVVASGGARGVTAAALIRLCREARLRLLLLGRTEPLDWPETLAPDLDREALRAALGRRSVAAGDGASPKEIAALAERLMATREIRQTLAAIEATGSSALYRTVDVAEPPAVAAAVEAQRQAWGPVEGLVHGAGILADRLIRDRLAEGALERAERVLRVKIDGLQALVAAVAPDRPAFATLFSSVAAARGNPGQADYAMANEALNRMAWALARRWPETRVSSINWGPWDGGMVDAALRQHLSERGAAPMPVAEAAAAFVATVLGGAPEEVESIVAAPAAPSAALAMAGQ
ncbi:MAG: SDR family oxidoreductase, partial [Pseudomonadota bacterium]